MQGHIAFHVITAYLLFISLPLIACPLCNSFMVIIAGFTYICVDIFMIFKHAYDVSSSGPALQQGTALYDFSNYLASLFAKKTL